MKVPFKYYVHDGAEGGERADHIQEQTGIRFDPEDLGRPFYEVTLYCEIDTETHEITLIRAEL